MKNTLVVNDTNIQDVVTTYNLIYATFISIIKYGHKGITYRHVGIQ
jgi:hypothetical protein